MILFITIAVICLLLTYSSEIVKLMQLSKFVKQKRCPELDTELQDAKEALERVRSTPAPGEYAQMVKTMRAQQRIKIVEEKIRAQHNSFFFMSTSVDLIGGYTLKFLLSLTLLIISIRNRYTPVMVFNDHFNLTPLEGLLSFPTGVHNAISVPVWVLSCNVTFRFASNLIKGKK